MGLWTEETLFTYLEIRGRSLQAKGGIAATWAAWSGIQVSQTFQFKPQSILLIATVCTPPPPPHHFSVTVAAKLNQIYKGLCSTEAHLHVRLLTSFSGNFVKRTSDRSSDEELEDWIACGGGGCFCFFVFLHHGAQCLQQQFIKLVVNKKVKKIRRKQTFRVHLVSFTHRSADALLHGQTHGPVHIFVGAKKKRKKHLCNNCSCSFPEIPVADSITEVTVGDSSDRLTEIRLHVHSESPLFHPTEDSWVKTGSSALLMNPNHTGSRKPARGKSIPVSCIILNITRACCLPPGGRKSHASFWYF